MRRAISALEDAIVTNYPAISRESELKARARGPSPTASGGWLMAMRIDPTRLPFRAGNAETTTRRDRVSRVSGLANLELRVEGSSIDDSPLGPIYHLHGRCVFHPRKLLIQFRSRRARLQAIYLPKPNKNANSRPLKSFRRSWTESLKSASRAINKADEGERRTQLLSSWLLLCFLTEKEGSVEVEEEEGKKEEDGEETKRATPSPSPALA